MTALQTWQERVELCRVAREDGEESVWQRLAGWYDRWARSNDYVELHLPRLMRALPRRARVLEIGPGTGAFTVPLAHAAREVVALEPSAPMRQILARNLAQVGLNNVLVLPQRAEDGLAGLAGDFDLALASHSLYSVSTIDRLVVEVMRLASQTCILMGTGEQAPWLLDLHRRLKGRERIAPPNLRQFYPVLIETGILADVEILWTSSHHVFDSEEDLVEWWAHNLSIRPEQKAEIQPALRHVAEWRGGQIGIYGRQRTACIWIDRERSIFAQGG